MRRIIDFGIGVLVLMFGFASVIPDFGIGVWVLKFQKNFLKFQ